MPNTTRSFARLSRAASFTAAAAVWPLSAGPVAAEEFSVADGDVAGLIGAINAANGNGEADVIHLAPGGKYTLTQLYDNGWGGNGLPRIISEITIEGNGATIERSSDPDTEEFRFFFLESGGQADLTLRGLTLAGGKSSHGGAIRNWGNVVTLIDCTLADNAAGANGGVIHSDSGGMVTLTSCTLEGNTAQRGGAINKHGSGGGVVITDSTFTGNSSDVDDGFYGKGGAVYIESSGTHAITGCTFTDNAGAQGGAIAHQSGSLSVVNCTMSGNFAADAGGAVHASALRIDNCTIAANEAPLGGGIYGSAAVVSNTIIADNTGGDTGGAFDDAGHNLVGDGSGVTHATSFSGDAELGPLADNGGPTLTHALLPGSPAIDAGDCAGGTVGEDQRGVPREPPCDIGAFEVEGGGCRADFNGDGGVDTQDVLAFLNAWNGGDLAADFNGDGTIDTQDVLAFLNAWAAGC